MELKQLTIEQLESAAAEARRTINAIGFRSRAEYDRACDLLDQIDNELCERQSTLN